MKWHFTDKATLKLEKYVMDGGKALISRFPAGFYDPAYMTSKNHKHQKAINEQWKAIALEAIRDTGIDDEIENVEDDLGHTIKDVHGAVSQVCKKLYYYRTDFNHARQLGLSETLTFDMGKRSRIQITYDAHNKHWYSPVYRCGDNYNWGLGCIYDFPIEDNPAYAKYMSQNGHSSSDTITSNDAPSPTTATASCSADELMKELYSIARQFVEVYNRYNSAQ